MSSFTYLYLYIYTLFVCNSVCSYPIKKNIHFIAFLHKIQRIKDNLDKEKDSNNHHLKIWGRRQPAEVLVWSLIPV